MGNLGVDVVSSSSSLILVPDILIILAAFALTSSKRVIGTLCVDCIIGLAFFWNGWSAIGNESIGLSPGDVGSFSCTHGPFGYILGMVFIVFVGVHTFTVPCILLPCIVAVWTRTSSTEAIPFVVLSTVMAFLCVQFEFATAYLFRQLQAELECNQRLLDNATDGFGVVDCERGVVMSASPKMLQTFGFSEMQGRHLSTLVDSSERDALGSFLGTDGKGSVPVLLTCSSQATQFEVRFVPYKMDGSKTGFFVQMVGESRKILRDAPPPPAQHGSCHAPGLRLDRCRNFEGDTSQADSEDSPADLAPDKSRNHCGHAAQELRADALLPLEPKVAVERRCSTLSLSSWTVSNRETLRSQGGRSRATASVAAPPETREVGTQAGARRPPPIPSFMPATGSDFAASGGRRGPNGRRKRQSRIPAFVSEGEAALKCFRPTPRFTRDNCLAMVASRINITGSGCCSRHVAWAGLLQTVSQELRGPCGQQSFSTDWQCPDCLSLNEWDEEPPDDEDDVMDQLCASCGSVVTPVRCRQPCAPAGERMLCSPLPL